MTLSPGGGSQPPFNCLCVLEEILRYNVQVFEFVYWHLYSCSSQFSTLWYIWQRLINTVMRQPFGSDWQIPPNVQSKMFNCFFNFLSIHLVPYWNSPKLFNPRLSSLVPLKIVLVEWKKHCFRLQNQEHMFEVSEEKKTQQGCTTQKSGLGMQQQTVSYQNPDIQISRYPYSVSYSKVCESNPAVGS